MIALRSFCTISEISGAENFISLGQRNKYSGRQQGAQERRCKMRKRVWARTSVASSKALTSAPRPEDRTPLSGVAGPLTDTA